VLRLLRSVGTASDCEMLSMSDVGAGEVLQLAICTERPPRGETETCSVPRRLVDTFGNRVDPEIRLLS
jgi:hypothetical protein